MILGSWVEMKVASHGWILAKFFYGQIRKEPKTLEVK